MYKIIGGDGREYGPVPAEQLKQWIAEGRVTAQTQIQAAGQSDWKPLSAFPDLAGSMPQLPPPTVAGPPPPGLQQTRTSGMAIASLVLGILGFCSSGLTGLFGLILGLIGLSRINRSGGTVGGKGLAIAGIAVSGVSLLFMPILLAAMLLPALAQAREKARTANCMSQMKQVGLVFAMYSDTHDGQLPPSATWCDVITQSGNLSNPKVLLCPSSTGSETCSYVFNANMDAAKWMDDPDAVVMICAPQEWNGTVTGPEDVPPSPHRRGYNVLFNDGHVEFRMSLEGLRWVPVKQP